MYDNFGNMLYYRWEEKGVSFQEGWYEYDSIGNKTFSQDTDVEGYNVIVKTAWEYNSDLKSCYSKSQDGNKETWIEFNDDGKKIYIKEKYPTMSPHLKKLKGKSLYEEECEYFDKQGKSIYRKSTSRNGMPYSLIDEGQIYIYEKWSTYNDNDDVIQIKNSSALADIQGNIIKIESTYFEYYLYDYEYYDDGKLKKKTCYRY